MDRRRHGDIPFRLALGDHRHHLLDEERIPGGGFEDPVTEPGPSSAPREHLDQLAAISSGASGSSRTFLAFSLPPPQRRTMLEQLRPCQAEKQDRSVAAQLCDVLDQVEERRLAPMDVVEDAPPAAARSRAPRAACGTPRRSPPASSPPTRRRGSGRAPSRRGHAVAVAVAKELLDDLRRRASSRSPRRTRDSGRARPSRRRVSARNSATRRDFPTPAGPRTVNSWHERSPAAFANASSSSLRWRCAPDHRRVVGGVGWSPPLTPIRADTP